MVLANLESKHKDKERERIARETQAFLDENGVVEQLDSDLDNNQEARIRIGEQYSSFSQQFS